MNIVKNGFLVALLLTCFTLGSNATTHNITFPTSGGPAQYVPNTLNVAVGDTIVWQGKFQSHPLASGATPNGVPALGYSGGDPTYQYVITKEGVYEFHCDFHPSIMFGTITTTSASVNLGVQSAIALLNYPNPAGSSTSFHFNLPTAGNVTMKLFDIKGNLVADILNGYRSSGENEVSFNTSNLASGTYTCKFESGAYLITRQIVVVKNK